MKEHEEHWDNRYRESDRIWSGEPNALLVREVTGMKPGRALDLGCGEGADVVWLARQGWRVTGVDVSRVALERAAQHVAEAGVEAELEWRDLAETFPAGEYDLVSAAFLHSFLEMPRENILRRAAAAVAPGGVLLVLGHAAPPSWQPDMPAHVSFPTTREVLAALDLPQAQWEVERSEEHVREMTAPDGRPATRTDNVLLLRRKAT
ncbi:class I SAM-dependent methyltransferase [Nonomuraea typhae]|uniref:class I SAM-dependent methyltransferase n=1 Tax=Nonomuraea typhae TaxID=2603600 RepID=UPI0012FCC544|nr:class I SAM-dependent methyltransferase [Nonomuraea typhae]